MSAADAADEKEGEDDRRDDDGLARASEAGAER